MSWAGIGNALKSVATFAAQNPEVTSSIITTTGSVIKGDTKVSNESGQIDLGQLFKLPGASLDETTSKQVNTIAIVGGVLLAVLIGVLVWTGLKR